MINLMPPDVKEAVQYAYKNTLLVRAIIIILAVSASLAAVSFFGVIVVGNDEGNLEDAVAQKEAQLETFQATIDEANDLANTIETIDTLIDQEEKFSVLLQQIGSLMPKGANLTALTLSNDRTQPVQIIAQTDSQEIATTLQNNLANSELFIGADIQNLTAILDDKGNPKAYSVIIITAYDTGDEEAVIQPIPETEVPVEEGGTQ